MLFDSDTDCPYCKATLQFDDDREGDGIGYYSDGHDGLCPHVVVITGSLDRESDEQGVGGEEMNEVGPLLTEAGSSLPRGSHDDLWDWSRAVGDKVPHKVVEFHVWMPDVPLPEDEVICYPGAPLRHTETWQVTGTVLFSLEPADFAEMLCREPVEVQLERMAMEASEAVAQSLRERAQEFARLVKIGAKVEDSALYGHRCRFHPFVAEALSTNGLDLVRLPSRGWCVLPSIDAVRELHASNRPARKRYVPKANVVRLREILLARYDRSSLNEDFRAWLEQYGARE